MVTPYSVFMPQATSIENFKQAVLGRSGGISASNLYQFQIAVPELPATGYTLSKHFGQNMNEGIKATDMVNYQLNMLCNEIQVPGVTMSSSDVKMPQKGMIQKVASAKCSMNLTLVSIVMQTPCPLNSLGHGKTSL